MSLKVKMLLTIIGSLVVIMSAIIGGISYFTYNAIHNVSEQYIGENIAKEGAKLGSFFEKHQHVAEALASTLELAGSGNSLTRDEVNLILKNILADQPEAVDSWAVFEPNAFDGQDAANIGRPDSDEKGRYVPLAFRDGSSYGIDKCYAYDTDPYYLVPKETKKYFITEPTVYKIGGKDVNMVTIVVPILADGQFIGTAGIDIDVSTILSKVNDIKLFETGYLKVIGGSGITISHPKVEKIGKMAEEFEGDAGKALLTDVLAGNSRHEILFSSSLDAMAFKIFVPFQLGSEGPTWILGSTIPLNEITKDASFIRNSTIGSVLIGVLLVGILIFIYIGRVTMAVAKIANAASTIATGDLRVDIDPKLLNRKDEIGHLAKSFSDMKHSLSDIAQNLLSTSQQVNESADTLTTVTDQASITAEDIAKTIEEIARGASDQAKDTEHGSSQVAKFGTAIEENQRSINTLNMAAKSVIDVVRVGTGSMEKLDQQAKSTSSEINIISEGITATYNSVSRIKEVSGFIAGISEQTNLLALNASIEAARAGESGRGFAVVADEIRKLAEASKNSTTEIDLAVKKLIDDAENSVKIANNLSHIISEQLSGMKHTSEQFFEIRQAIENMVVQIEEMTVSGNLMLSGKERMMDVMSNLSAIAEENAASTEETAASTEEQTAAILEISRMTDQLSSLSAQLRQVAEQFKL